MEHSQKSQSLPGSSSQFHPNETLYTQVSDDSFLKMEQICKDDDFEDFLAAQQVPNLDDTLDEINFILSLGSKLEREGKLKIPNTRFAALLNFDDTRCSAVGSENDDSLGVFEVSDCFEETSAETDESTLKNSKLSKSVEILEQTVDVIDLELIDSTFEDSVIEIVD